MNGSKWLPTCVLIAASVVVAWPSAAAADPTHAAVAPQQVLEVPVAGVAGVPADAAGVLGTVTVTNPAEAGFVAVSSCAGGPPGTSNLNFPADTDAANGVLVPLSAAGSVCATTSAATDAIFDVDGFVPKGSPVELLDEPVRGGDSRSGVGFGSVGPVAAGETVSLDVSAIAGVGDVDAVAVNVTSTGAAAAGFLAVGPCGAALATSSVNFQAGVDVANLVVSAVAADGTLCVTASADTHVVVDVAAKVATGAADPTVSSPPVRSVDSRLGIGTTASPWSTGETREVSLAGAGLPVGAMTGFVNLTATGAAADGFVQAHRCGVDPAGSNLNFTAGVDRANFAAVPLDATRSFCLTASAPVHLIVDTSGGATMPSTVQTGDSVRAADTRAEAAQACWRGVAWPSPDTIWVVDLTDGSLDASITSDEFEPHSVLRFLSLPKVLDPDCDEVVVASVVPELNSTESVVQRARFDGTVVEVGRFDRPASIVAPLIEVLEDGTEVWFDGDAPGVPDRLERLLAGTTFFEASPSEAVLQVLDSDVVAASALDPISVWRFYRPGEATPFRTVPRLGQVSPGLDYQLGPQGSPLGELDVFTLDGAFVTRVELFDLVPPGPFWSVTWIDDGLLSLCARGVGGTPTRSFVWNIFTDPVEIPLNACVEHAR